MYLTGYTTQQVAFVDPYGESPNYPNLRLRHLLVASPQDHHSEDHFVHRTLTQTTLTVPDPALTQLRYPPPVNCETLLVRMASMPNHPVTAGCEFAIAQIVA